MKLALLCLALAGMGTLSTQAQTITFSPPSSGLAGTSVTLDATASSGPAPTYQVLSGPAVVSGSTLTYTGVGTVMVQASQPGTSAQPVAKSIPTTLLTEPVGTASVTVSTVLTFSSVVAVPVAGISVTTEGAPNLDFSLAPGGSCSSGTAYTAGETCTVNFTFTPTHPGLRFGGITLTANDGSNLASSYIYGEGTGPQLVYLPQQQGLLANGFERASGVAVDGNGNVFVSNGGPGIEELTPGGNAFTLIASVPQAEDVAVDGAGNIIAVGPNAVYEVEAVNGTVLPNSPVLTLATGFSQIDGVTVDGNGDVFVANEPNTPAPPALPPAYNLGAAYELVAVNGSVPQNAPVALVAEFSGGAAELSGVAVDVAGNVYVSSSGTPSAGQSAAAVFQVQAVNGVIPSSPTISTITGFSNPSNVAIDTVGNLYVTDYGAHQLDEIVAVNGVIPTANPKIIALSKELDEPQGVAVDASGNVYIADSGLNAAVELSFSAPPTLTFASTVVGLTSTDSPQTVTVLNNGNAPLLYVVPASGTTNPTIVPTPPNFTLDAASTCNRLPLDVGTIDDSLAPGASCTDVVSFTPLVAGTDKGELVTTDNNLNVAGATQIVPLVGIGIPTTLKLTLTATPADVFLLNPVTLTAQVSSNTGTVSGEVTFYDNTNVVIGTAMLSDGTATLVLSNLSIGPHSITAYYSNSTLGAVTSAPAAVLVQDFTLAFSTPSVTIQHGGTATFTLRMVPVDGMTIPADIALAVSGEPDTSAVTWSEQTIPAGSGAVNVTLTIHTPDYPVGPFSSLRLGTSTLAAAAFGLLLLPFGAAGKSRSRLMRAVRGTLVLAVAATVLTSVTGCGSGWKTQQYTVSVTGTSGPLTHTTSAALTSQ